ncbi:family 43 glycosylhydrolase [Streptomyces scabiei]|uniref:family 43 glycosylhydrolase n=1 Tax=Streptomyces scabiei TaxID=1930 RepID=UPI0029AFF6F9|nr:family 43 glycosylhydrolase [Streptomyces scabiei]MDX3116086.1 family 43 glycosylhydrolase [Streptomyces scabiei]
MRAAAGRVGADGAARADRKASYSTATSTSRKTLGLEAIEKGEWEMLGKSSKWKIASLLLPIALALAFFGNNAQATASASAPRTDASVTAPTLQNDVFWKDTSGNPIYSQGGGVLKVGSTYYWYGVKYNGAVTYYNNPAHGKNGDTSFSAITSYSSTDLVHWKFEGNVMTSSDLGGAGWVGRVGVAHNARTGKYVLISQLNSGLVFATSSTPAGHFTRAGTQSSIGNVTTGMSGDQSVFTDDDGNAYLVFSNKSGRSHLYVAPLRSSDFLHVEAATNIYNSSAGGREGNIMFKHDGTYYFCSSDLHGWNASHTYCITSTKINGPYSSEFVMQGTDADFSHVTQTGLAFQVTGASGSFVMFGGDRWSDFAGNGIGYNQWLPVTFNGKTPIFHSLSQWNVDAAAGTWSVAGGNNHVLNPSFEADRVSQNKLAGWTNQTNGGSDPNSNSSGGNTGRWAMTQYRTSAYTAVMYQDISLPNGTYTLSAWVKSSGGQKTAKIFAKNFGASEMNRSISQSIGSWTKISISGIDVTNGSIQVGVSSDANAGNRVNVDDFSLVQTGGTTASGKR